MSLVIPSPSNFTERGSVSSLKDTVLGAPGRTEDWFKVREKKRGDRIVSKGTVDLKD